MSRSVVGVAGCLIIGLGVADGSWLRAASLRTSVPPSSVRALPNAQTVASPAAPAAPSTHRELLTRYCVTCHNQRLKTAGLSLDTIETANVAEHAEIWEKVVQKLRTGAMPPAGSPRPEKPVYDELAVWLESELDRSAAAKPNAGQSVVHRLNRVEYANSIRDLLALDVDVKTLLPQDESGYGFDNIADVLSVTPGLLERYMLAAAKISRIAVGDPSMRPGLEVFSVSPFLVQRDRVSEDLPFNSRGGIAVRHTFPIDGDYVFRIRLERGFANGLIKGLYNPDQLGVYLDGVRVKLFNVGGDCIDSKEPRCSDYAVTADNNLDVRLAVKAGPRLIGVAFLKQHAATEGIGPEREPAGGSISSETANMMGVDHVEVEGPFASTGSGDTPSRRKIFTCRPSGRRDEEACARTIVSTIARRAYRRPLTEQDTQMLLGFYQEGRKAGGFEGGIQFALEGILASPFFLLRVEQTPANATPGVSYRVSDLELASRLSFFLWSSIPDDQLLDVASKGRLREPSVLEQQVRRMMADERATTLVTNFASQWLYLKDLRKMAPDPWAFPDFDDSLREAFQEETELFLGSQMRDDRSVVELLTANYTFVNERLARFYGIPHVYGMRFRRVPVTDPARAGLLGHGSILTVTSYSTRTSPVVRGRYILQNLLGSPIPPPPANVPPLPENEKDAAIMMSVRSRMEEHRKNPACSVCHTRMDPLGFALENFNAIGKWRNSENGAAIDTSGTFPGGGTFETPADFRKALLERGGEFVHTFSEKLLTYALGRGVEYYDMPAIRKIVRDAKADNYRWSDIVLGITRSTPFQMRVAPEPVR